MGAPSELPFRDVRECEAERRDQQDGWPGTAAAVPGPQVHLHALSVFSHSLCTAERGCGLLLLLDNSGARDAAHVHRALLVTGSARPGGGGGGGGASQVHGRCWERLEKGACEERQGATRARKQELQDRIVLLEENDKKILEGNEKILQPVQHQHQNQQHQRENEEQLHCRADPAEQRKRHHLLMAAKASAEAEQARLLQSSASFAGAG